VIKSNRTFFSDTFVTLWPDWDFNQESFAGRVNNLSLSYRATWSRHQQLFTLNLPSVGEREEEDLPSVTLLY